MNEWALRDLACNWHPYTQMAALADAPPLVIERAEGIKLYDTDGRWYYDTISSWWCNVHGHGHPRIREAMSRQLAEVDHVLFASITHKGAVLLAEKLLALAPAGLKRVFYSDNGSTAVEVALKMSLQYWRNSGRPEKTRFICLERGYHGDTVGCMSVSGVERFNSPFGPLMFDSVRVPPPYCYRCPAKATAGRCAVECAAFVEEASRERESETAAVILEPLLLAAGGMISYPPEYLTKVAQSARRHGAHLIFDEVATGFGRTGTMFACEQAAVSPDFLCLSKGLTSGTLPFAATLTTSDVYEAFLGPAGGDRTFYHGHTFTANPLGCAAALASLELFEENRNPRPCAGDITGSPRGPGAPTPAPERRRRSVRRHGRRGRARNGQGRKAPPRLRLSGDIPGIQHWPSARHYPQAAGKRPLPLSAALHDAPRVGGHPRAVLRGTG